MVVVFVNEFNRRLLLPFKYQPCSFPFWLEAIVIRLEAIAIRLEAIAIRCPLYFNIAY